MACSSTSRATYWPSRVRYVVAGFGISSSANRGSSCRDAAPTTSGPSCQIAAPSERYVDDRRFAGAFPDQRAAMPAAIDRSRNVAAAAAGTTRHRPRKPARFHLVHQVESALCRQLPLGAVAVAARVDDLGVASADLLDVDAHPLPRVRQQVGQEDVGAFDEFHQQLQPLRGAGVQCDAALAPVRLLDEVVHSPVLATMPELIKPRCGSRFPGRTSTTSAPQ